MAAAAPGTAQRCRSPAARREAIEGYIAIAPWLLGFVAFTAGPILFSLYMSFTYWDLTDRPRWAGLQNYGEKGAG